MEFYTKEETARRLRLSTLSVDRLRKAGKLPCRKFRGAVRFTESDIQRFVENSQEKKAAN